MCSYMFPSGTEDFVADYLSLNLTYYGYNGHLKSERTFIVPCPKNFDSADFFDFFIDYDLAFKYVKTYLLSTSPKLAHYLFDDLDCTSHAIINNEKYTLSISKHFGGL